MQKLVRKTTSWLLVALAVSMPGASAQIFQDESAAGIGVEAADELRGAFLKVLHDPDAAHIRQVRPPAVGGSVVKADMLCGLVNAKNRFGGYVGYRPFAFDRKTKQLIITNKLKPGDLTRELELATYRFTLCHFVHDY